MTAIRDVQVKLIRRQIVLIHIHVPCFGYHACPDVCQRFLFLRSHLCFIAFDEAFPRHAGIGASFGFQVLLRLCLRTAFNVPHPGSADSDASVPGRVPPFQIQFDRGFLYLILIAGVNVLLFDMGISIRAFFFLFNPVTKTGGEGGVCKVPEFNCHLRPPWFRFGAARIRFFPGSLFDGIRTHCFPVPHLNDASRRVFSGRKQLLPVTLLDAMADLAGDVGIENVFHDVLHAAHLFFNVGADPCPPLCLSLRHMIRFFNAGQNVAHNRIPDGLPEGVSIAAPFDHIRRFPDLVPDGVRPLVRQILYFSVRQTVCHVNAKFLFRFRAERVLFFIRQLHFDGRVQLHMQLCNIFR